MSEAELKITIDMSGANMATINPYNKMHKPAIVLRQCTYLIFIVGQDSRAGKRVTRPMLGFKSFWTARCTIVGIAVRDAQCTAQLARRENAPQTPAEQCYTLAA